MAATSLEEMNTFCSLKTFNSTLNESKSIFELIRCLHLTVENIVSGTGHISLNNTNADNCIWEIKNGVNQPTVTISFQVESKATNLEIIDDVPESVAEYIEVEETQSSNELNDSESDSCVKPATQIKNEDNLLLENTTYVNLIPDNSFNLSWNVENDVKQCDETFIKAVVMEENQMLHKPLDMLEEPHVEKEVKTNESGNVETSTLQEDDSESNLTEKTIQPLTCTESTETPKQFKRCSSLIENIKIQKIENVSGNSRCKKSEIANVILVAKTAETSSIKTRSFSKKQELENKMIVVKPKSFPCQYCSKKFTRKYDLRMHHRIHTGEKPYACRFCEKRFSQMNNKEVHERIHTGEKPYSCTYCDQTFTQTADKKKHERIHTGERPYSCIHCGKSFTRLDHKKSHERTHTGEKPFTCKHCGKRFTDSSTKGAHEKRHLSTSQLTEESIILICTQ